MTTLATAWMLGCLTGLFMGITAASRRRPTCRELMRDPAPRQPSFAELLMPPRFIEGRTIRGNGGGAITTPKPEIIPKPQPHGGRLVYLDRHPDWRRSSAKPPINPQPTAGE